MKVCIIVEGSYPYTQGGVSAWVQQLMERMADTEFCVQALCASPGQRQQMKYRPPKNLSEVHNVFLSGEGYGRGETTARLTRLQQKSLQALLFGGEVNWDSVFTLFRKKNISLDGLLGGSVFLRLVQQYYQIHYPQMVFTDFLWTLRSMYQPVFNVLKAQPVQADLYHAVCTGYAGLLGSYQSYLFHKLLILSEHGIYTREREEEIIRADWVQGVYKDLWINQFRKLSACGYQYAAAVTSLYEGARQLQQELGCPEAKTIVIPNGIPAGRYDPATVPPREEDGCVHIGALLRVAPIKDVKTMIAAFAMAKARDPRLRLHIMGPLDEDPAYVAECRSLAEDTGVTGLYFTGPVATAEVIHNMDYYLFTSLSEGQPLTILEAFAAGKPCIVTNVGSCRELVEGIDDGFGPAGLVTPPMNPGLTAAAILRLAAEPETCRAMGEAGRQRVLLLHREEDMIQKFGRLYSGQEAQNGRAV